MAEKFFVKINKLLFLILLALLSALILPQMTAFLSTCNIKIYPFMNNLMRSQAFNNFSIIFLSIIIDAFPFIMIGVLISSIIQVFISEEIVAKFIPKNKFLGLIIASLIGIIFPVCDCAVVPIARRFAKKGVPIGICITFLLAVPIVNPISIAATYYAFADKPIIMFLRIGLGIFTAISVGYIMQNIENIKNPLKLESITSPHSHNCNHTHTHVHKHEHIQIHGNNHKSKFKHAINKQHNLKHTHKHEKVCSCGHVHHTPENKTISSISIDILDHISLELYDVGKYLIFGALISSLMQTFITKQYIMSISSGPLSSIFVMQILAFILSICSTADAFIAKSFLGQFTDGSIITFLILGPMLDIKNTLMLSTAFTQKFFIKLIMWIILITSSMGMLVNIFMI